jgi:hypothetical protein
VILASGFRFTTIALGYDAAAHVWRGPWSPFGGVRVCFDSLGSSAVGRHIYATRWDTLQVFSPMVWSRVSDAPAINELLTSGAALEAMQRGEPLLYKDIQGTINAGSMKFSHRVVVLDSRFEGAVNFTQAQFLQGADFGRTEFKDIATFVWARFLRNCSFAGARFRNQALFSYAQFAATNPNHDGVFLLNGAQFADVADFRACKFEGTTCFGAGDFVRGASYFNSSHQVLDFTCARFHGELDLSGLVGTALRLGGLRGEDVLVTRAHERSVSFLPHLPTSADAPVSATEPTRIHGVVSLRAAAVDTLVLEEVTIDGDLLLEDANVQKLSMFRTHAGACRMDGIRLQETLSMDALSAQGVVGSVAEILPMGASRSGLDSRTLAALAEPMRAQGRPRDMNDLLLGANWKEGRELWARRDVPGLAEWMGLLMVGFGRSATLVLLMQGLAVVAFAGAFWVGGSRTTAWNAMVRRPRNTEITFWCVAAHDQPPNSGHLAVGAECSAAFIPRSVPALA